MYSHSTTGVKNLRSSGKPKAPTLEEVPMLTIAQQYRQAIGKICRPNRDEEAILVEKARSGCQESRKQLIESCLLYIFVIAHRYTVFLPHDDSMDLVQLANLKVVELLDRALTEATHPVSYLRGIARREIQAYCIYRTTLIVRGRYDEKPTVIFLERKHDDIPEPTPTYKKVCMTAEQAVEIIEQIPDPDRTVMLRYTGLDGDSPEPLKVISRRLFPQFSSSQARYVWLRGISKAAKIIKESGISYQTCNTEIAQTDNH